MKQFAKKFSYIDAKDNPVTSQLNNFLKEHPEFKVQTISYYFDSKSVYETLFVVFNVEEV